MSYVPTDEEKALRGWIVLALDADEAGIPVIYGRQDAPRSNKQAWVSIVTLSRDEDDRPSAQGLLSTLHEGGPLCSHYARWENQGRAQIDIFGPQAQALAKALIRSRVRADVQTQLQAGTNDLIPIAIYQLGQVLNGRQVVGTKYEGRAVLDVIFGWNEEDLWGETPIETVSITTLP